MRNEKNQTHSRIFDSRNTHKKKCRRKEKKKIAHTDSLTELTQPIGVVSP